MTTAAQRSTTLTVGMAHYADFDGAFFTIQSIRLHHVEVLDRTELILVDNSPGGTQGKMLEGLIASMKQFFRDARYIPMADRGGTSQTRNRIFQESKTEATLCLDCHVLLLPGSLQYLLDWYDQHPDSQDMLSGPLLADQVGTGWTHFNNQWRGHMWGTWGVAWRCPECGAMFSPVQCGDMAEFRSLVGDGTTLISSCECRRLPSIPWAGHEQALKDREFGRVLDNPNAEPFDIPGQGLGLFTCRTSAWLGFNEHFRGFGGEEMYVHEKFRQAGRRNLCLPSLQWLHRFARPQGARYQLRVEDKIRNYLIGHQELGLDTAPVREHFLASGVTADQWDAIAVDPIGYGQSATHRGGGCNSCKKEIESLDMEQTFAYYRGKSSDFNEHFPKLRELAGQCDHVTEFGSRDYGVIALLAGKPKAIRSYNAQQDGAAFWKAEQLAKAMGVEILISHESPDTVAIEETDLLFYDPATSNLLIDLNRLHERVRRYIVVHDTDIFGRTMPGGGPGLKRQLMEFMHAHREWSVVYSTTDNYGLTVMSRNPADKPQRPSIFKMGPTFLKHLAEHVADGVKNVSAEHMEARMEECWLCDMRTGGEQCGLCGCPLLDKAKWRSSRCDANKWMEIDQRFLEQAQ